MEMIDMRMRMKTKMIEGATEIRNLMYFRSKRITLLILGITSLVCSRAFFVFIDDPEGPNLLVVAVMALVLYFLSLLAHSFCFPKITGLKGLILTACTQLVLAIGIYFLLTFV